MAGDPPAQAIAAEYSEIAPADAPPVGEAQAAPQQLASSIWPEDKAVLPQQPVAPPAAESEHRDLPADLTAPPPAETAPSILLPPHPAKIKPVELAERSSAVPSAAPVISSEAPVKPFLNPHPPERDLRPLSIIASPAVTADPPAQNSSEAMTATFKQQGRLFETAEMRAGPWPEDTGRDTRQFSFLQESQEPAEDKPVSVSLPAIVSPEETPQQSGVAEAEIPAPPQPAPSAADRLAAIQPVPVDREPMMESQAPIGDPGIIIDRFVAHEEPVAAMPLPERRGFLAGEVTTEELSASLGPDFTAFGDRKRGKLLEDYRAKIRAHLEGVKPPGGFCMAQVTRWPRPECVRW
jgi:hypothetical protein